MIDIYLRRDDAEALATHLGNLSGIADGELVQVRFGDSSPKKPCNLIEIHPPPANVITVIDGRRPPPPKPPASERGPRRTAQ